MFPHHDYFLYSSSNCLITENTHVTTCNLQSCHIELYPLTPTEKADIFQISFHPGWIIACKQTVILDYGWKYSMIDTLFSENAKWWLFSVKHERKWALQGIRVVDYPLFRSYAWIMGNYRYRNCNPSFHKNCEKGFLLLPAKKYCYLVSKGVLQLPFSISHLVYMYMCKLLWPWYSP